MSDAMVVMRSARSVVAKTKLAADALSALIPPEIGGPRE